MAIVVKTDSQIERMRKAGRVTAAARKLAHELIQPGATTELINKEVYKFIKKSNAIPTFLGYGGFPASICASVNEEVIHGIPSKRRVLNEGDIVSIDVGATLNGYVGDCAGTYACGTISKEAQDLIDVTRQSFFEGIKFAKVGYRISDIGAAVQEYAESHGCGVVRDYVGHGVGSVMHEEPEIPNFGRPGHGARLVKGMTIAVEPMITAGTWQVKVLSDGWTVVTADGSLAAHYENTLLITDGEPEILTMSDDL